MQSTSLGFYSRVFHRADMLNVWDEKLRQVFIMWIQMKEKAPFRVVEMGAGGAIFNRKKNANNKNGWSLQISCFSFGFWINGFCGEKHVQLDTLTKKLRLAKLIPFLPVEALCEDAFIYSHGIMKRHDRQWTIGPWSSHLREAKWAWNRPSSMEAPLQSGWTTMEGMRR